MQALIEIRCEMPNIYIYMNNPSFYFIGISLDMLNLCASFHLAPLLSLCLAFGRVVTDDEMAQVGA
jgi:hypothetical protein